MDFGLCEWCFRLQGTAECFVCCAALCPGCVEQVEISDTENRPFCYSCWADAFENHPDREEEEEGEEEGADNLEPENEDVWTVPEPDSEPDTTDSESEPESEIYTCLLSRDEFQLPKRRRRDPSPEF